MSIQTRFEDFHHDNPQVLLELERLAEQWFSAGHLKCGLKMLWEVLRWELGLRTRGDDGFRLNNNFTSRYARLLVERHPEWDGRIETRELRA